VRKKKRQEKAFVLMEGLGKEAGEKGFRSASRAFAKFAEKGRKKLLEKRGLETEQSCGHVDFMKTPFSFQQPQRSSRESSAEVNRE